MTVAPGSQRKEFRPGDRADSAGIYRAIHLRHRMPHELTVFEGEIFPPCKRCGEKVRFEQLHVAPRLKGDVDLLLSVCAMLTAVSSLVLS